MPALQLVVRPAGHGKDLVGRRDILRAQPQPGRHQVPDDLPVEGVAGHRHAIGADDVFRCPSPPADFRPHMQDRKVAGAAAEVSNQDELVVLQALLVAVGGRHRLVLEHNLFEPALLKRLSQPPKRELIIRRVARV